jgi:hypothetical protein
MMSQFELSSRAALCRQLASQDPANQTVWMAEARSWSRLAAEMLPEEHRLKGGITARLFLAFNKLVAAQHEPTPTGRNDEEQIQTRHAVSELVTDGLTHSSEKRSHECTLGSSVERAGAPPDSMLSDAARRAALDVKASSSRFP